MYICTLTGNIIVYTPSQSTFRENYSFKIKHHTSDADTRGKKNVFHPIPHSEHMTRPSHLSTGSVRT